MIRLALLSSSVELLRQHVEASAPLEEGAFVLLREGRGIDGLRLVGSEVILPEPSSWEIHERRRLRPSAQWLSAVIGLAIEAGAGLLFVHSHPKGVGDAGLSPLDRDSFSSLARDLAPMLDGPFAAAVVHQDGWAADLWDGAGLVPVDKIQAVARTLQDLSPREGMPPTELDARQKDALGRIHDRLRQLDVAVVGSGGLGSPIAEQLVRMGVRRIAVLDGDLLDTPSNLRRVFGAIAADLQSTTAQRKVDVVGRHLRQLGFDSKIETYFADIRSERAFRRLLDFDVVISATDTHGSRAVINYLGSGYFLPVIDVGVRVASKEPDLLAGLLAEVRVLSPTTPCLWCLETIKAEVVRAENLPPAEQERLRREGYLPDGFGDPAPSVAALTVMAAGLATSALLALLAEEGDAASSAYWIDGFLGDSAELRPTEPRPACRCRRIFGRGDTHRPALLG